MKLLKKPLVGLVTCTLAYVLTITASVLNPAEAYTLYVNGSSNSGYTYSTNYTKTYKQDYIQVTTYDYTAPSYTDNTDYQAPSTSAPDSGAASYTDQELDLLARLITAEADSESYNTKVAVGAVVLNRVDSPLFPNSLAGVIYQIDSTGRYQFEPVLNGWINVKASPDAIRAAKEALSGTDPTKGALYFFESWVPNKFLKSMPVSIVLDSFTFAF